MTILEQYIAMCKDIQGLQLAFDNGEIPPPPQTTAKKNKVLLLIKKKNKEMVAFVKAHPNTKFPECKRL
jgi:hypothetical protein